MDGDLTDAEIAFYVDTMNAANFRDTRRMALELQKRRANPIDLPVIAKEVREGFDRVVDAIFDASQRR